MPKIVLPTLMSDTPTLTDPIDIITYILRHYMSTPKNISDTFPDREISFRWDDAEVGHDKEELGGRIMTSLRNVLARYFPTASSIDVLVETEDVDAVRYNISIDIMVFIDTLPYTISKRFSMNKDGTLAYSFEGDS